MSVRRPAWGLGAAAIYLAVAIAFAGGGPVLPLYDTGPIAPQPYRWVDPPPEFQAANVAPEGTKQEVAMTDVGTVAASVVTPDGQAAFVLREGAFATRLGEINVIVEIEPLDPDRVGPPSPGLSFDGNAYRVTATYPKEEAPAVLTKPATVVLRSPMGGTRLLRRDAETWSEISAEPVAASLQVFAETDRLGTFVVAQTLHAKPFPWMWVSIGASALAVGAAWFAAGRIRTKKAREAPARGGKQPARRPGPARPASKPRPRKRKKR